MLRIRIIRKGEIYIGIIFYYLVYQKNDKITTWYEYIIFTFLLLNFLNLHTHASLGFLTEPQRVKETKKKETKSQI